MGVKSWKIRLDLFHSTSGEKKMKKLFTVLLVCIFLVIINSSMAEPPRIAVIDLDGAIGASNAASTVEKKMDEEFDEVKKKLQKMGMELDELVTRQTRDGDKISAEEKGNLTKDIEKRKTVYELMLKTVSQKSEKRYSQLVKDIDPLIQKAIKEIVESGEYDIVHHKKDILYSDAQFDISAKLTERLNQLTENVSTTE